MNSNSTGTQIYNTLLARNFDPSMMTSDGQRIQSSDDADLFSFNYTHDDRNYGTVVVLLGPNQDLQVYYADNVAKGMEPGHQDSWYDFLHHMRMIAKRNLLTFDVKDINKLKYTMQGMSAIKEGLFEGYYGTSKTSYNEQGTAKIIIKHSRAIGEGEQRFRNIQNIFIENERGERFRMPVNNIMASKVMARHVAEGGTPYDTFGTYIIDMVEEIQTLGKFVRVAKSRVDENNQALVDSAIKHYGDLKKKAKRMISRRGYREAIESYDPAEFTDSEIVVDEIRELFSETRVDDRIEQALPILAKVAEQQEDNMKEVDEFEQWAEDVTEGTWAVPNTDKKMADLKALMAKPITVGPDATNATNVLYDLVGDDQLFDDLEELAMKDPDADARPVIQARLQDMGYSLDMPEEEPQAEDIDIDKGTQTLKAERDPMLEDELARLLRLAK